MASVIPRPARDFLRALTQAVDTATSGEDVATYDRAIAQPATQPASGRVLGDVLRSLLEDTHPDGLTSHDITLVVGRC
jgi:alkylated DNA nucleotide flippase Atl1